MITRGVTSLEIYKNHNGGREHSTMQFTKPTILLIQELDCDWEDTQQISGKIRDLLDELKKEKGKKLVRFKMDVGCANY